MGASAYTDFLQRLDLFQGHLILRGLDAVLVDRLGHGFGGIGLGFGGNAARLGGFLGGVEFRIGGQFGSFEYRDTYASLDEVRSAYR